MSNISLLLWLYWNPPREAFRIPWLDHPVAWYGVLFVTGYLIGYFIFVPILTQFLYSLRHIAVIDLKNWKNGTTKLTQEEAQTTVNQLNSKFSDSAFSRKLLEQELPEVVDKARNTGYFLADKLIWFTVIGTVIGARLGEVFFYDWARYRNNPLEILQIWKGGLASHGGVTGVALALFVYYLYVKKWYPELTYLRILDYVAIPSALAACFIRLGNFVNQEIVGIPSTLPWAIVFGHPADGSLPIARHPVQLYEALAYLITFFILWKIWKVKGVDLKPGTIIGWLFILIFSTRFVLEFWKNHIDASLNMSSLEMGQFLSIPFILVGVFLVLRNTKGKY